MVTRKIDYEPLAIGPFALSDESMAANQREVVRRALKYVKGVSESEYSTFAHNPSRSTIPETNQVLTIIGRRGTGKTSVLMSINERIQQELPRVVVTRMLCPDQIGSYFKMPVGPALLRLIEEALDSSGTSDRKSENSLGLRTSWAVRIVQTFDVLSRDSIGVQDWSDKLSKLLTESMQIADEFKEWITASLESRGISTLVVPIDDADISIGRAEEVAELIRIYLSHPKIVTIVACDIDEFERRIRNARLAELPTIPNPPKEEGQNPIAFMIGLTPAQFQSQEATAEGRYVEAMLAKILPPALRLFLDELPSDHSLSRPVWFLGRRTPEVSVLECVGTFDEMMQLYGAPSLQRLLKKHPEIVSGNFRTFINQYLQFREIALGFKARYVEIDSSERQSRWREFLSKSRIGTDPSISVERKNRQSDSPTIDERYPKISTPEDLLVSQAQMDFVRGLLISPDFAKLVQIFRREYGINLPELTNIHDFCTSIFRRLNVLGTTEHRIIYRIGRTSFDESTVHHLIGFACDWLLEAGMPFTKWFRGIDGLEYVRASFRPIRLPSKTARLLKKKGSKGIALVDPVLRLTEGNRESGEGSFVSAPGDMDRLFPFFVADLNSFAAYLHVAVNARTLRLVDDAMAPYLDVDKTKRPAERLAGSDSGMVRVLGLVAHQIAWHLSALEGLVLYRGSFDESRTRSPFFFTFSEEILWMMVEFKGLFQLLFSIFESSEIKLVDKLLSLSYLSDLPMRVVWQCDQDPDVKVHLIRCRKSIAVMLDQLTEMEVLVGRPLGSCQVGRVQMKPRNHEGRALMQDLRDRYPLFDWARRGKRMNDCLRGLEAVKISDSWDSLTEAPPSWIGFARLIRGAGKP